MAPAMTSPPAPEDLDRRSAAVDAVRRGRARDRLPRAEPAGRPRGADPEGDGRAGKTLAVDDRFVFLMIFTDSAVRPGFRKRVLMIGIPGSRRTTTASSASRSPAA